MYFMKCLFSARPLFVSAAEISRYVSKAEEAFNLALDYFSSADDVYRQVRIRLLPFLSCLRFERDIVLFLCSALIYVFYEDCGLSIGGASDVCREHTAVASRRMKPQHGVSDAQELDSCSFFLTPKALPIFLCPSTQAKCMARVVEMQLSRMFADVALRGVSKGGRGRLSVVA